MIRASATTPRTLLAISFAVAVLLLTYAAGVPVTSDSKTGSTSSSTSNFSGTQLQQRNPWYRLNRSDVIEVEFTYSPEFNQTLTVEPDGYITLKAAGAVQAEGKTLAELTKAIGQAYSGILHDPLITISLKDFDKPYFLASGQIGKPGKYELRSETTLTEAVALAGGFTDAAKHSQVVLFRRVSKDTVEARVFDVKHMLNSRNLEEDPYLKPGDMLYVPQSKWSKLRKYLPSSSMGMYANPNPF